jgi:hypothetical protein
MKNYAEICDLGRVRTCNHQSRNLIFYPVELRSLFLIVIFYVKKILIVRNRNLIYTNNFLTIVEMVFPSAVPPNCTAANPITFPIEAIPVAPVSAMIFAMITSTSASLSCAGRNFSITAI